MGAPVGCCLPKGDLELGLGEVASWLICLLLRVGSPRVESSYYSLYSSLVPSLTVAAPAPGGARVAGESARTPGLEVQPLAQSSAPITETGTFWQDKQRRASKLLEAVASTNPNPEVLVGVSPEGHVISLPL